jgi:hypothetical protein
MIQAYCVFCEREQAFVFNTITCKLHCLVGFEDLETPMEVLKND